MPQQPKKKVALSVVVPMYNETARIRPCLERICAYCGKKGLAYELLVVDDGSVDESPALVEAFAKANPNVRLVPNGANRGKGYSVRHGMREARGDAVLFTDVDLSAPMEGLDAFLPLLKDFDVVIGSRDLVGSRIRVRQPLVRRVLRKGFRWLYSLLLFSDIQDTQCGFKLFSAEAARRIFSRQTVDGFCFDVEILFLAKRLGLRVKEAPVEWSDSVDSRVNLWKVPPQMFRDLLRIKLNDWRGRYR